MVTTQDQLSADLAMGTVMLKAGDMKAMSGYYQKALGLEVLSESAGGVGLGRQGQCQDG
jgi:catechol 2,3-dioxygenase